MSMNDPVLKTEKAEAKALVSLGFVLLLICLFIFAWIGSGYWEVWAFSILGVIAMFEGCLYYFKSKRGLSR